MAFELWGDVALRRDPLLAKVLRDLSIPVTMSLDGRTRSLDPARFSTTGLLSEDNILFSVEIAGPAVARSTFASVIGSDSSRTSSRCTGTVWVTFSVTPYFLSLTARLALDLADSELLFGTVMPTLV